MNKVQKLICMTMDIKKACLENLTEQGLVKYFYHSPRSVLPIPDILGDKNDKNSNKTEYHPFLGNGKVAENWLKECQTRNIKRIVESDNKYLFWITKCQNRDLKEHYDKQFIIGYLEKEEVILRPTIKDGKIKRDHFSIIGTGHLYTFDDALLTKNVFGEVFNRIKLLNNPFVDKRKTKKILEYFSDKHNVLEDCVEEMIRIDKKKATCWKKYCDRQNSCLRYNR